MNVLFCRWKAYGQEYLEEVFWNLGCETDSIEFRMQSYCDNPEFENILRDKLNIGHFDLVFSLNYFGSISNVCDEFMIPYVAWTVDAPLLELYSKSIYNECNYIFSFDTKTIERLNEMGVKKVFSLPLAVYEKKYRNISVSEEEKIRFGGDVAFVGSTYQNRTFYGRLSHLPAELKGYLDGIVIAQENVSGYNFLEEMLSDELMSEIEKYVHLDIGDKFLGSKKMIFATSFLGTEVTFIERVHILNEISKRFDLKLYTNDDISNILPKVKNCGTVDYYSEMSKVFRCSKVNLNVTLRNIERGIPLRVFDVLASQGFLLTNKQVDLAQCFIDGEDLVTYDDVEDLMNKIEYYLSHEKERIEIAQNGYQKVMTYHTFEKRIVYILEIMKCHSKT